MYFISILYYFYFIFYYIIISHSKTVYLCGDFNIDIFKYNNNKYIKGRRCS